jgi:CheY-like chemotaxis protein
LKCAKYFQTMKTKTILLAEDNPNDIELTLLSLKACGDEINVEVVNDGVEALEYLRLQGRFRDRDPGHPVVILLDIKMPRMDGIEVLNEIKNDSELKMIPVVMLTSSREEKDLIQSYMMGVNAYVVKPVDFYEFNDSLKQLGSFWSVLNELPPII